MLTSEQIVLIRERMETLLDTKLPDALTVVQGEGLTLSWDGKQGTIIA